MDTLVSTEWLAHNLGEPDIAIVDASAFMPNDGRDPAAEFVEAHIPGARFLDLDDVGSKVGQQLRRPGPREDAAEVEDPNPR